MMKRMMRGLMEMRICYSIVTYIRQKWWRFIDRIIKFLYRNGDMILLAFALAFMLVLSHVIYFFTGIYAI